MPAKDISERSVKWKHCFDSFRTYLLNDHSNNFTILIKAFDSLLTDMKVVCEIHPAKDPVVFLKSQNKDFRFTVKQRRYMLTDYFENEWKEKEFII